jgi:chromosomal replication initiator protein
MSQVSDSRWSRILDHVRLHHRSVVRDWFDALGPAQLVNGVLEISADDLEQVRYLSEYCRAAFAEAAQAVTDRLVTVAFTAAPVSEDVTEFDVPESEATLNPHYRFEHFVTGPCNRMAHAACVAVGDSPGRAYNPLFIHGGVGLGKTHLMQAVCHRLRDAAVPLKIMYLSCEVFANHFLDAVEGGAMYRFRHRYRHVDALVIDDVQLLAERERSQEEFFHTFNSLYQTQKQIILTSDNAPRDIPSLEERLVSRFNWGLVARLDPPCLETRMAILRSKAKLRCITLPEDAAFQIAGKVDANIRELEGALLRVQATSQEYGGRIDSAVVEEALSDKPASTTRPITLHDILALVSTRYDVKPSEIYGRKRSRSIALPRQICMFVAREITSLSLEEVGTFLGGRDHTTVLHACRTIAEQRKVSADLDNALDEIVHTLKHA